MPPTVLGFTRASAECHSCTGRLGFGLWAEVRDTEELAPDRALPACLKVDSVGGFLKML